MKKSNQTIEESLEQIKFMMNYDSSKTLTEQLESPGGIAGKTALGATGAAALGAGAGAALDAGVFGVAGATGMGASAVTLGHIVTGGAAGGTMATMSAGTAAAIGGSIITGAAALALIPLVLWLADKDKAYPKTKKLFEYVKANKEKIDQVERGLDDDTIQTLSDDLYNAMKGLGTRNKDVFRVFNSLVTISDFSALIATFNEDHMNEGAGDLLEWLDSDIDISSTWNKIYVPCRNLVKKFAKKLAKENPPPATNTSTGANAGAASGGYRPVQGTNEDPYKLGTSGAGISKVQECLGITTDGKFGPITQSKLMELAKQYRHAFTNDDIEDICKMARPRQNIQISPMTASTNYKPEIPPLKMMDLAPKTDTQTLAPGPRVTVPQKAVVPDKKGVLGGLFKRK